MDRREFIKISGIGMGSMMVPVIGNTVTAEELLKPMDVSFKKKLANVALNAARNKGATYTDVRIGRYLNQFLFTREAKVQNTVNTESFGIGVRVIAKDTWGFAATNDVSPDGVAKAAEQAVAIALANSRFPTNPVKLAAQKGYGDVSWKTAIKKNAFEVPIKEKVELLTTVDKTAMDAGASFITSVIFAVNEQKYFASSDGTYADQDVHRIWTPFFATAVDKKTGKFKTRNGLSSAHGMGYEYLDGRAEDKTDLGVTTVYGKSYDMIEDAKNAGRQVQEKLKAPSVKPGKYSMILDPSHTWLTIHESVGHPLELDRVLGYEANFAGTSFATMDKWETKKFKYGSDIVNLVADKTQVGSLGDVGYDDEGVKTKEWHLVKDGILVNYQAIRDQVHLLGEKESHGCCFADSWSNVQFQRMPNVSLQPGKEKLTPAEMIKEVDDGIYIIGAGSFSIDQQRYNFQFGGQMFYEIKNGKIAGMVEDVAYQSNTQEFWNSCTKICDDRDYRMGASFFDGKGQPPQISAVSHGSTTARFDNINVINTARKLG